MERPRQWSLQREKALLKGGNKETRGAALDSSPPLAFEWGIYCGSKVKEGEAA